MKKVNGVEIRQRLSDGYIDAMAICDACDKDFSDYAQIRSTKRFISELSRETGIETTALLQKVDGVDEIWVHPQIAINISQWASPKLAVKVPKLVLEWYANETKKTVTKEVTVKSESTSGVKFGDIDPDFAAMIGKAARYNPDK